MSNIQSKFKKFILNDIFWFNKSELNFGIYKIFRQKEQLIREKLDDIVVNIENELSSSNKSKLDDLREKLYDVCVHKSKPLETIEQIQKAIEDYCQDDKDELLAILKDAQTEKRYDSTKVYEYLYQFFNLYYEKGDFGYTPRSFRTYSIPYVYEEYLNDPVSKNACETSHAIDYRGEETLFTWKTKDSYYIKSNKFLNSVTLNLEYKGQNYTINTNIIEKDEDIKDDKKVKQYRLVSIKKEDNTITLNFNISDFATPKHTIYLAMLSVIEEDIDTLDYSAIFADKKLKEYFETLPFEDKTIQTSLLDGNQQKLQNRFKELIMDDELFKYLFVVSKSKGVEKTSNIFKSELSGEEDKTQLKSKVSKLMLNKKEYASKVYTKTTAKAFLELDKKEKFEIDSKDDLEKLYAKDDLLNFFYRLDRGINLFYAGVDSDYFIHKNLKRFLSVELDKFIKNYIFTDTDAILLMDESAKKIATFARVFKEQANVFIELLSSIEEFQKYLWEKRKMVKSSNYIISSNKIEDTNLLEIVLTNRDQIDEWENLGITKPNERPNIIELQSYSYPIDTKHFDDLFKYQLLSQFENIEEETSGLLIKSENYQALRFLEPKYTDKKGDGKIKCIYIDPPYNTGNDGFVYKDNFKSASWLSMMNDRLEVAKRLMREDGVIFISIDDNEIVNTLSLQNIVFKNTLIQNVTVKRATTAGFKSINLAPITTKEYITIYGKNEKKLNESIIKLYVKAEYSDDYGTYIKNINDSYHKWEFIPLNELFYESIKVKSWQEAKKKLGDNWKNIRKNFQKDFAIQHNDSVVAFKDIHKPTDAIKKIKQKSHKNKDKVYIYERQGNENIYFYKGRVITFLKNKIKEIDGKQEISEIISDVWTDISWDGIAQEGNIELKNGKKPEKLLQRIINLSIEQDRQEYVLDFFGGSGTTAAVAYKMNKKFISVEMNDYFETKMLKRMKYTMFGNSGGIPSQRDGGVVQYIKLEQYDDIIDNLKVVDGGDYSKIDFGYIYEPDKNQINFRMENEIKDPLGEDAKFDLFASILFHEGLELINLQLNDDILEAKVKDKYGKECMVLLGADKAKVEDRVKTLKEEKEVKVYTNQNIGGVELILAETFKGK